MSKKKREWMKILNSEEFMILREESTEMPGSSDLNGEKRKGSYHCVGCDQKLFS
jgi:peptide-methionine (R)-S-oxide reductase